MAVATVDLHTHLLEKDVKPEVYWRSVKEKGLDAVAITEHAGMKPEAAYRLLIEKKPKGIVLVPGAELNTEIGHVLAFSKSDELYGLEQLFKKGIPIKRALAIAEREGLLLSISHPWGFSYDSAAYVWGERKLEKLVAEQRIGVEAFNGMFGNIGGFFYGTNWVRKPMNFFDFIEKSRVGRKTRLGKLGKKGREKLDKKGRELVERGLKPIGLAEKACFATAGSDAHKPDRIGAGIMKVEVKGKLGAGNLLDAVEDKRKVKWVGPFVRETAKGYVVDRISLQKAEFLSGVKYAAKKAILKKVGKKIRSG